MEVLEGIEKTVYEYLRQALINAGLTVDVLDYTVPADYEAALQTLDYSLQAQGLNVVLIKGVTFNEFKYSKEGNYYSIEEVSIENGTIGASGCISYESNGDNTYKKLLSPDQTVDVSVRVRIVSNNLKVYRLLRSLQLSVFGHSKTLSSITDAGTLSGEKFLFVNRGSVPQSDEFKELLTIYVAKDVWPHAFTVVEQAVPRVTTIENEEIATNNLEAI